MKILWILLFLVSCASRSTKTLATLEILNQKYEVLLTDNADHLVLEKSGTTPMKFKSTNGNDREFVEGAFMGRRDIKGEHWHLSDFSGKKHEWIYSIFIARPESEMGKRLLDKDSKHTQYSQCVNQPNNQYIVFFVLGDIAGLFVGCLNSK